MAQSVFFLPLLLQILLTILLYIALAIAKARAARAGLVNLERRALHDDAWPDSVQQINNSIRSQFEVPVLFYVLTVVLWQLNLTGTLIQGWCWLFVLSRYVHAYVHTGSNYVPLRRRVFMAGCVVVMILALAVAASIFRSMV